MNIGKNIKSIREKKGFSRKDLAEKINVTDVTISRYENGKRDPNVEMLNKIANSLNVSIDTLTCDEFFDREIFKRAMLLASKKISSDMNAFMVLGWFADYDTLTSFHIGEINVLPTDCIKGLLDFISEQSDIEFKKLYTDLIETDIYDLDNEIKNYCLKILSETIKNVVDKAFPTLDPLIQLLSNPKIEMVYDYTYNDLATCGYQELLFIAIEKTIRSTLQDIKEHEKNGDIFDGVCSWITKESPVYEILKKSQENNKKVMKELTEKAKNNENK